MIMKDIIILVLCSLLMQFLCVNNFVFSRTPICKSTNEKDCHEFLTGQFTLRNEENFKISGSVKGQEGNDPSGHGISVTVEKSPVMFVYDLKYELDVFSSFLEEIIYYKWSSALDHDNFCLGIDMDKCAEGPIGRPLDPEGLPLRFNSGTCCKCQTTTKNTSDGGIKRSNLKCGMWDSLWHRANYMSKHCPRVMGPWYSAFSIGPWKWDFELKVLLEWYAPPDYDDPSNDAIFSPAARAAEYECFADAVNSATLKIRQENPDLDELAIESIMDAEEKLKKLHLISEPSSVMTQIDFFLFNRTIMPELSHPTKIDRSFAARALRQCRKARSRIAGLNTVEYVLNITTPEIYDKQFQLGLKIIGSTPQTDAFPPPMNDRYLFIPTSPKNDTIVQESRLVHGCGLRSFKTIPEVLPQTTTPTTSTTYNYGQNITQRKNINKRKPLNYTCLSHAMLIPANRVDLSGLTCDRIGVNLATWGTASGGSFCDQTKGHCMGNQIGDLRREDEDRIRLGETPHYFVGTHSVPGFIGSRPLFLANNPSIPIDVKNWGTTYGFGWTYEKEHVTSLEVELAVDNIVWIQTAAPGEIYDIRSDLGCKPLKGDPCIVDIFVRNIGVRKSRFTVSIPYCIDAITGKVTNNIREISPVGRMLEANHTSVFRFHIETSSTLLGYYSCKVRDVVVEQAALCDAQTRRLDQNLFNVSFLPLDAEYQGQQIPLWEPHIGIKMVDAGGSSIDLVEFLGGIARPLRSSGIYQRGSCNCRILNIFCITANFWGCIARVKGMIWSGVSCIGLFASLYVFGPSLKVCAKIAGRRMKSMRRRQQKYAATEHESHEKRKRGKERERREMDKERAAVAAKMKSEQELQDEEAGLEPITPSSKEEESEDEE